MTDYKLAKEPVRFGWHWLPKNSKLLHESKPRTVKVGVRMEMAPGRTIYGGVSKDVPYVCYQGMHASKSMTSWASGGKVLCFVVVEGIPASNGTQADKFVGKYRTVLQSWDAESFLPQPPSPTVLTESQRDQLWSYNADNYDRSKSLALLTALAAPKATLASVRKARGKQANGLYVPWENRTSSTAWLTDAVKRQIKAEAAVLEAEWRAAHPA